MAMKPVLTLLSVLVCPSFDVLAQQPTSAGPPAVPAEIEEWMRAAWGMDPQVLGFTDTHFLLSLSESERQGAFLFKAVVFTATSLRQAAISKPAKAATVAGIVNQLSIRRYWARIPLASIRLTMVSRCSVALTVASFLR